MSKKRPPLIITCFEKKTDCNRYNDGNCTILTNTVFRKPCPFYKSVNEEKENEETGEAEETDASLRSE